MSFGSRRWSPGHPWSSRSVRLAPPTSSSVVDTRPAIRAAVWGAAIGLTILATPGCTRSGPSSERSGEEMRRELPEPLSRLLPPDVVECCHETAQSPATYQLWIFRRPGGSWLDFPKKLAGRERHDLPAQILEGMLAAKAPWLAPGRLQSTTCRYTHWTNGDTAYQIREIVTDRGWFASVEEFRR
jgi:hypothetical protein